MFSTLNYLLLKLPNILLLYSPPPLNCQVPIKIRYFTLNPTHLPLLANLTLPLSLWVNIIFTLFPVIPSKKIKRKNFIIATNLGHSEQEHFTLLPRHSERVQRAWESYYIILPILYSSFWARKSERENLYIKTLTPQPYYHFRQILFA